MQYQIKLFSINHNKIEPKKQNKFVFGKHSKKFLNLFPLSTFLFSRSLNFIKYEIKFDIHEKNRPNIPK